MSTSIPLSPLPHLLFLATVEEATTHESEQLCLPRSGHYPKPYIECLVVDTGTLEEYVRTSLGRRQEAAAVKLNIPCVWTPLSAPAQNNVAATSQIPPPLHPSPSLSHRDQQEGQELELGPHRDTILKAATCMEALEYNEAILLLNQIATTTSVMITVKCAILFGRGLAYYRMEQYAHAESLLQELKEVAMTTPTKDGSGFMAEIYLGDISAVRSEHEKAATCYGMACETFTPQPPLGVLFRLHTPSLSQLYVRRGGVLRKANKVMQALEALKEGVACARDDRDLLSAHTSLGNLYQGLGDSQAAAEEYLECVTLAERSGDLVSLGWNHGNLGNAYVGLQQKDKATHHLHISLELTLQHEPTPQSIGRAYNNLGTAYQSLSDLDKAELYYNRALDQSVYGKDSPGQARALGNLGNIAMLKKDYDSAHRYFTDTLGLTSDPSIRTVALHNRGCCAYEKAELLLRASKRPCPPLIMCGRGGVAVDAGTAHRVHLTDDVARLYDEAREDLGQVISSHEATLHTMKGSMKGLTLSVSLFEANSRTFHRLQDCLCLLGEWEEALERAEQCRARTLGEVLLKRLGTGGNLTPPLSYQQIREVVQSQSQVVVFLSYTGSRLLVWVLAPDGREVRLQLNLDGLLFDEKPLDIYLRYGLPSEIGDRDLEMFGACDYSQPSPLHRLYTLLGSPILRALRLVASPQPLAETHTPSFQLLELPSQSGSKAVSLSEPKEVVLIPDSYTSLPFIALCDPSSQQFIGDTYQFHTFPSILTMVTVMGHHHGNGGDDDRGTVTVEIGQGGDSENQFCIVGDPAIPIFTHAGEEWSLGRLPHAAEEAKWVGHILCATPILHEAATKPLVVAMLQRAKVVHVATHGSAVSGFLAFAGQETVTKDAVTATKGGKRGQEDDKSVLLFPHEVERLTVGAGLVVLSSCDSGRGTVRVDGVQGMCRAFLVAGAQAILTTLWRVPDESAGVFMQFFYRYLMDGMTSAQALQKAVLSVRCFEKYSKPLHWGAYQLTGRTVRFDVHVGGVARGVAMEVGKGSVFPRLSLLLALEGALIGGSVRPSYVQLLCGSPYLDPCEVAIDFVLKHHALFRGVFWLNGGHRVLFDGAQQALPLVCDGPALVVIDGVTELSSMSPRLEALLTSPLTHIIILYTSTSSPTPLIQEVDTRLVRGCTRLQLEPLSTTLATQRVVHTLLSRRHFAPHNRDQRVLAQLVSLTFGCPDLAALTAELVYRASTVSVDPMEDLHTRLVQPLQAHWKGADHIGEFADDVIELLELGRTEQFAFWVLSTFGPIPILQSVVARVESMVLSAVGAKRSGLLIARLLDAHLLRVYPSPVVVAMSGEAVKRIPLYTVPSLVCESALRGMSKMDATFALAVAHKALVAELAAPTATPTHPDDHTTELYCAGMCRGLLSTADYLGDDSGGILEELYSPLVQLLREGVLAEPCLV